MNHDEIDTDQLVRQARDGDPAATQMLFERHRAQLKRMISIRMDAQLAARLDESDIIQDALMEATRRLDDYIQQPAVPFYVWLRGLAWDRLIQLHRHHIDRQKRSVRREQPTGLPLSHQSATQLVDMLAVDDTSPSARVMHDEESQRACDALQQLPERYREVLILRHLEQLSIDETAAVLGITAGTVKSRQFRAISRLHESLSRDESS